MEDPNEASVFLKTHVFSLKFYRKYKDSNPERDGVFIRLNHLLGETLDSNRFDDLNSLILEHYGSPKSEEEAMNAAIAELDQENFFIEYNNKHQTWCPEIKMPLLSYTGDKANADLITDILVRYAQIPRTVTQNEFEKIKTDYMPVQPNMYHDYIESVPYMFSKLDEKEMDGQLILSFPRWKSFKDWCIEERYVRQYKDNVSI
jgi:hypothetical protein